LKGTLATLESRPCCLVSGTCEAITRGLKSFKISGISAFTRTTDQEIALSPSVWVERNSFVAKLWHKRSLSLLARDIRCALAEEFFCLDTPVSGGRTAIHHTRRFGCPALIKPSAHGVAIVGGLFTRELADTFFADQARPTIGIA
jgi:hypothetical protein